MKNRTMEILKFVEKDSGMTARDISRKLGLTSSQVANCLCSLEKRGLLGSTIVSAKDPVTGKYLKKWHFLKTPENYCRRGKDLSEVLSLMDNREGLVDEMPDQCPKCRGMMYRSEDWPKQWACVMCGARVFSKSVI